MADEQDEQRRRLDRAVASDVTAPLEGARPSSATPAPAASDAPPTFTIGELVAGRYKVTRLIGAGGMGEVYEVEDLLLRERVALKTIRAGAERDERTVERFKREIQLARKVTHENVCRIFDVGLHRPVGSRTDVAFLTMELLAGETLAARVSRGPIAVADARPIVQQMTSALAAAHRAGVVHRDFKSANVILVPEGKDGLRVVVTDFGLAVEREDAARASRSDITGAGGVIGSPAYMAPEQVEGTRVSAAADVYALGVVLFEMVTGRLPFVADTPLATAVLRLREDAPSPRKLNPELEPQWDEAILRCLRRPPAERFQSAVEVSAALGCGASLAALTGSSPTMPVPKAPAPWSKRKLGLAAAVLVGAAAAAMLIVRFAGRRPPTTTNEMAGAGSGAAAEPAGRRRSVAVLGFKNLTGRADTAAMAGALEEMLAAELGAAADVRMVSGESVARARRDLALGDDSSFAPDTLKRIRRELDADYVLVGSYMALPRDEGGKIRFDMKLQDTRTGETVATLTETGTEAELLEMVARTGAQLRDRLGLAAPSAREKAEIKAVLPDRPEAARLYAEGLRQLRVDACSAARAPLEQAVATEPDYPLAHSALAEALYCLGHDERALSEAKRAVELAAGAPQVAQQAQARLFRVSRQPDKAIEIYAKLFDKFPDDFDFGVQLAELQTRTGKRDELRHTLVRLRALPPPAGDNPRLDLLEASAQMYEDPARASHTAELARGKAEQQGARLVVAEALLIQAAADTMRGQTADVLPRVDRAKEIFEAAGDLDGLAKVLSLEAYVRQTSGDTVGVHKIEERAAEIAKELDNPRELLHVKLAVAQSLMLQDARAAERAGRDCVELAKAKKDRTTLRVAYQVLGSILAFSGDVEGMAAAVDDMRKTNGIDADTRHIADGLELYVHMFRGDFERALAGADKLAAALSREERVTADLIRMDALVALGRPDDALRAGREALAVTPGIFESGVHVKLALIHATLGRYPEARRELALISDVARATPKMEAMLASLRAELQASSGKPDDVRAAVELVHKANDELNAAGLALLVFENRLAEAHILLVHGRAAEGRAAVAELARDARAAKLVGYALRAERLLTGT